MKVIVNRQYGGFSISALALEKLAERKGFCFRSLAPDRLGRQHIVASSKPIFTVEDWNSTADNGITVITEHCEDLRTDPDLISVVEELGEAANSSYAQLEVVEIPDDIEWTVEEYDGLEWIAEKHRTW